MSRASIAYGMTGMFLVFALIQLNDPDPLGWVGTYLVVAGLSAWAGARGLPRWVALGGSAVALAGALWIGLGWDGSSAPMGPAAQGLFAEEVVREAAGLALVGAWGIAVAAWFAPGHGKLRPGRRVGPPDGPSTAARDAAPSQPDAGRGRVQP